MALIDIVESLLTSVFAPQWSPSFSLAEVPRDVLKIATDRGALGQLATAKTAGVDTEPSRPRGRTELVCIGATPKDRYFLALMMMPETGADFLPVPGLNGRTVEVESVYCVDTRVIYRQARKHTRFTGRQLNKADSAVVAQWIEQVT